MITVEETGRESPDRAEFEHLPGAYARLRERIETLERRLKQRDEHRRAMVHIMSDLNVANKKLGNQRKAMLHILADYEQDRTRLAQQTERLNNSRRALLHILTDSHQSNLKLETSRKAMIHIMGDLQKTTDEITRREKELREKQAQLVQAGKLATLGELTTGVAHELNNPLNNIALFIGNVIDALEVDMATPELIKRHLNNALRQVHKATEIISHLRTFGRAAPASREVVRVNEIIHRALSLMDQQLRGRQIEVKLELTPDNPRVLANAIQLEQVFINLLANSRDALKDATVRRVWIGSKVVRDSVELTFSDTGPGIREGMEQRIFDPFFTTKEVGQGTGLGLSITYGIVKDHKGTISVLKPRPGEGATFTIQLPLADDDAKAAEDARATEGGAE
ncbi:MAG TPA: ATP-binding protein [Tepidisphaeraceae bacterium]|nr:ATP-binding protein [Tepidisphaeraceae bacterium]